MEVLATYMLCLCNVKVVLACHFAPLEQISNKLVHQVLAACFYVVEHL